MTLQERLEVCLVRAMFLLAPEDVNRNTLAKRVAGEFGLPDEVSVCGWEDHMNWVASRTA